MKVITILIGLAVLIAGCSSAPFEEDRLTSESLDGVWTGLSKITYPGPDDGPIDDSIWVMYYFHDDGTYEYAEHERYEVTPPVVLYDGTYEIEGNVLSLHLGSWHSGYSALHVAGDLEVTLDGFSMHLYQKVGDEFPTFRWVDLSKFRSLNPDDFELGER